MDFRDSFGILNHLLTVVGVEPVGFLTSSFWANTAVIIATVWSRAGFFMVIFIAGLQAIPTDYYEAARLDGATGIEGVPLYHAPAFEADKLACCYADSD